MRTPPEPGYFASTSCSGAFGWLTRDGRSHSEVSEYTLPSAARTPITCTPQQQAAANEQLDQTSATNPTNTHVFSNRQTRAAVGPLDPHSPHPVGVVHSNAIHCTIVLDRSTSGNDVCPMIAAPQLASGFAEEPSLSEPLLCVRLLQPIVYPAARVEVRSPAPDFTAPAVIDGEITR